MRATTAYPVETGDLDRLSAALRLAPTPTPELIRSLIAGACTRLPNLGAQASQQITCMIEAEAFTDVALGLVRCELPQWSLRRLVRDGDAWLCALSHQPHMPEELDDTADGRHAVAALAILDAFLEARRRTLSARELQTGAVPSVRPIPDPAICCDNFS